MTGQEVFEQIRDAMYERQRLPYSEHLERHKRPFVKPHDLRSLLADCEAAFDKVDAR